MIQETELSLFVPAPELLVRLASGEKPLGISAGPPHIWMLRETFFDTPDQALRRRGMTCKLKQGEDDGPSVVVTMGEDPDSEGITTRSRLIASAVGMGIFETLRGNSEVALQIQQVVNPRELRPQVALDIQRLGRIHRRGILRSPVLHLLFDRIAVQAHGSTAVIHELRIRRTRPGGPLIKDLARKLRDEFHLFPDGQSTLQRAYRVLALERKAPETALSPYALSLALAVFRGGEMGLLQKDDLLCIPTFRGSGEDAARALAADLTGSEDHPLIRLGVTEPRIGRQMVEVWVTPDPPAGSDGPLAKAGMVWIPWHALLEMAGRGGIRDGNLLSALLLLTRRRMLGQLGWVPEHRTRPTWKGGGQLVKPSGYLHAGSDPSDPEVEAADALLSSVRLAENTSAPLEKRLKALSSFSAGVDELFARNVRELKRRILALGPSEDESGPVLLLDLISIRIRGLMDRVYSVLNRNLIPDLEGGGISLRGWEGLMHQDRRTLLQEFSQSSLPDPEVITDWGPGLLPSMPPGGVALGLTARVKGSDSIRFFHVILDQRTPTFFSLPGGGMGVPLEEVVRGLLISHFPELERAETHLFRFRMAEVTIREAVPTPIVTPAPGARVLEVDVPIPPGDDPLPPPEATYQEKRVSVVTEVMTHLSMPENHQVQLLRALERQVGRQCPLLGWSDLHAVAGPLLLSGLEQLLTDR